MIGERLKAIRRRKRISQETLGEIVGVQKTTISLYESGKSNPSDMVKTEISRYFNVSLDYLLGLIDEPVPYYTKDAFLKLPDNVTDEEKFLLSEMLKYLNYRRLSAED
ncbi:MAG: helix-turn-helix domain-containing protein [Defluviitaleaceae bacterium]|nr:helix-turn-helix domain-containing protein [Defluviitaleaceae bacterium]